MSFENLPKSAPCSTIVSAMSKYSSFKAFQSGGFDFESRDSLSAPRTHKISTTLPRLFLTANEIGDSLDADARFGSACIGLFSHDQLRNSINDFIVKSRTTLALLFKRKRAEDSDLFLIA